MALPVDQALPLIAQYESGNRNVPNSSGPGGAPASTAGGYYQIINGTWQQSAPKAGVDLNLYPTAMSAPQDVQTQVAGAIYNAQGFQPWSSNARLMSAVAGTGIGGVGGGTSLSDIGGLGTPGGGTASPNTVVSNGLGMGSGTNTAPQGMASIWEMLQRGALVFMGFGIVMVAIVALLWQSKTVKVSAADLADDTA